MKLTWPWTTPTTTPSTAEEHTPPAGLHQCPQCRHITCVVDEHWLTITSTRDNAARVTVCSPRCAVLWLEAAYRPTALGVAR